MKANTMVFWLGLFGCLLFGQYLEGGNIAQLIQPTAAVITLFPILFLGLYSYGLNGFMSFISRCFSNKVLNSDREYIEKASTLGFLCGAMGMTFGMIHVMSNLSDSSKLGAGIAVAIVSAIYGAVPAMMLLPLKPFELSVAKESNQPMRKAAGYSALVVMFGMVSLVTVLYALGQTHV